MERSTIEHGYLWGTLMATLSTQFDWCLIPTTSQWIRLFRLTLMGALPTLCHWYLISWFILAITNYRLVSLGSSKDSLLRSYDDRKIFLKNVPTPASSSFVFAPTPQTHITILTTNKCEKCPSSIRRWDSNSQPSDSESPSLTTRLIKMIR